jgi:hypothetical protein
LVRCRSHFCHLKLLNCFVPCWNLPRTKKQSAYKNIVIRTLLFETWFSGIVSACLRGYWSYGSWDRIPPGCRWVAFRKQYVLWNVIFHLSVAANRKHYLHICAYIHTYINTSHWLLPDFESDKGGTGARLPDFSLYVH